MAKFYLKYTGLFLSCLMLQACSEPAPPAKPSLNTPYLAMARGKVDVEGGLLNLPVLRDGVFVRVYAKPNDKVHQGDVLAELDNHAAMMAVGMATAELHHAQAELLSLNARLPVMQQTATRWQQAAKSGVAEQQHADEAVEASRQLMADIAIAQTTVEMAQQKLRQARHEVELQRIVSPIDGEVINVLVQTGSTNSVQDHTVAFQLLPNHPLIIHAEVNESYIAQIHLGQMASVELESNPDMAAFKAIVVRIGRVLEASHLNEESQLTRIIECTLQLEQASPTVVQNLRIGQNVLVKFHE